MVFVRLPFWWLSGALIIVLVLTAGILSTDSVEEMVIYDFADTPLLFTLNKNVALANVYNFGMLEIF